MLTALQEGKLFTSGGDGFSLLKISGNASKTFGATALEHKCLRQLGRLDSLEKVPASALLRRAKVSEAMRHRPPQRESTRASQRHLRGKKKTNENR